MNIIERIKSPVSPFFKTLRAIGLVLASISAAVLTAPVPLPALITNVAGYLAVAGSVISMISQATVPEEPLTKK